MKNLCDNCRFLKLKSTNYCAPYGYDDKGNVIFCQSYFPERKNIIKCIISIIKKKI